MRKKKPGSKGRAEKFKAFNVRLPERLTDELDRIAAGAHVPISRNHLIERVLDWYVEAFEAEVQSDGQPRLQTLAGYVRDDWYKAVGLQAEGSDVAK